MRVATRVRPVNLKSRLSVVLMLLTLASTGLVVRAVDLQVVRKEFYQGQGDARYLREVPIPVSRGSVLDRNGEPLAVSTPVESIWANPQELLQHPERVPDLARALGMEGDALKDRLRQRADKEFIYLKRHLNPDDAASILALKIPGVNSQREFRRYYPSGEVTAHVLGFTNIDDRGQEGLELAFDEWLAGKPGAKRVIRDRLGHIVEDVELLSEPQQGRDLMLSIDRRIQYLAYRELKEGLLEHGASSGSMVVLDAPTGEVLAMVNLPSYNSNALNGVDTSSRRNRAMTDLIEPGSTMKAFTVAAALESGKWKPETPVDANPGTMTLAGHLIRDTTNKGLLDVTGVITHSSNIGAAKIALTLPNDHLYDLFKRFGFGESTGSGFPGEAAGVLAPPNKWGPVEKATMSYGYGLSVTPLQLAQAYGGLANGGRLRAPTFVKGAQNPESAVLDPTLARTITGMLETVVTPQGSALKAAVRNYRVAGKTGTSRKAVAGGYESRYISTFAGFVPASNPRLVGVVVIHDPKGVYYGGLVSAPVFSKVMDGALRLLDVAPDNVQKWYADGAGNWAPIQAGNAAPDYAPGQTNYEEGVPQ
ncbi:peptidoglycan D,D-transpeptidase FtsI family protein [Tahibacter amnicola]|uniref:Peptidoglycan D,D-transpeptidase FtsI n=1 Tax=Tahibacter amnicola TaxID=2976241 RepID=A0ABY6BQR0_9GAMM|nr:penicillin-binding protein 2 [Tahibacter amnicola]UXI70750.1 penicillin-binding protein 2 [Tahibacter amnicola]